MKTHLVISTQIQGNRFYVHLDSALPGGRFSIRYDDNPSDANVFYSEKEAREIIPKLWNPVDREFIIEPIHHHSKPVRRIPSIQDDSVLS